MSFDIKQASGASGVCERELILSHPPLFLPPFKQISNTLNHLKNIKHKLYEINQNTKLFVLGKNVKNNEEHS